MRDLTAASSAWARSRSAWAAAACSWSADMASVCLATCSRRADCSSRSSRRREDTSLPTTFIPLSRLLPCLGEGSPRLEPGERSSRCNGGCSAHACGLGFGEGSASRPGMSAALYTATLGVLSVGSCRRRPCRLRVLSFPSASTIASTVGLGARRGCCCSARKNVLQMAMKPRSTSL